MDQELLCFHYPKGSISVVITCLLFPRTLDVCVCVVGGAGADNLFTHRPPGQGKAHPSLIYRTVGHLEILLL